MGGYINREAIEKSRQFSLSGQTIKVEGFDRQKPFSHSIVADRRSEKSVLNPQLKR